VSSKSPLPERQFARSSQGCAFLFLKISKFNGGSVSVFSKIQNLAVGWGMKKPYLENLGRRFGRLVAVEYVCVKSGSSLAVQV
jgi:hypothetical protein